MWEWKKYMNNIKQFQQQQTTCLRTNSTNENVWCKLKNQAWTWPTTTNSSKEKWCMARLQTVSVNNIAIVSHEIRYIWASCQFLGICIISIYDYIYTIIYYYYVNKLYILFFRLPVVNSIAGWKCTCTMIGKRKTEKTFWQSKVKRQLNINRLWLINKKKKEQKFK